MLVTSLTILFIVAVPFASVAVSAVQSFTCPAGSGRPVCCRDLDLVTSLTGFCVAGKVLFVKLTRPRSGDTDHIIIAGSVAETSILCGNDAVAVCCTKVGGSVA